MDGSWKDQVTEIAPGVIGALVALRWVGGTPWQLGAALLGGSSCAYYGTPHVAGWLGVSAGLSGFLLGLFGMAIASRVFDAVSKIELDLNAIIGRRKP